MKTIFRNSIITLAFGILSSLLISCSKNDSGQPQYKSILDLAADNSTSMIMKNLVDLLPDTLNLDESGLSILKNISEEEKLARDVYSALYEVWNEKIFYNISLAEDTHMNAVLTLLKTVGSADTIPGEPGIFSDPAVQQLYTDLVANGSVSLEEAFKTGALIEEMDIFDLRNAEAEITDENVIIVFDNLMKGSRNHLRAFTKQLTNLGVTYVPVYLTADEYNTITTSAAETGKMYRMNGHGRGFKGNGNCSNF
jgi:hypothetical protein